MGQILLAIGITAVTGTLVVWLKRSLWKQAIRSMKEDKRRGQDDAEK